MCLARSYLELSLSGKANDMVENHCLKKSFYKSNHYWLQYSQQTMWFPLSSERKVKIFVEFFRHVYALSWASQAKAMTWLKTTFWGKLLQIHQRGKSFQIFTRDHLRLQRDCSLGYKTCLNHMQRHFQSIRHHGKNTKLAKVCKNPRWSFYYNLPLKGYLGWSSFFKSRV